MLYNYYSEFACQVEEMDAAIKEEKALLAEKYQEFKNYREEL